MILNDKKGPSTFLLPLSLFYFFLCNTQPQTSIIMDKVRHFIKFRIARAANCAVAMWASIECLALIQKQYLAFLHDIRDPCVVSLSPHRAPSTEATT